jgi:hypothetical protein
MAGRQAKKWDKGGIRQRLQMGKSGPTRPRAVAARGNAFGFGDVHSRAVDVETCFVGAGCWGVQLHHNAAAVCYHWCPGWLGGASGPTLRGRWWGWRDSCWLPPLPQALSFWLWWRCSSFVPFPPSATWTVTLRPVFFHFNWQV